MPKTKQQFDMTRRILFGKGKTKVEKATGILARTQLNWERHPEKMKARGMAMIIRARGLSDEEIMLVLKDLAM